MNSKPKPTYSPSRMLSIVQGIDRQQGGWARFVAEVVRLAPWAASQIREGLQEADDQDRLHAELVDVFGGKSAELRLAEWRAEFAAALVAADRLTRVCPEQAATYGDADAFRAVEYLFKDLREWEAAFCRARGEDRVRVVRPLG
ncbi:hypothetical protein TR631_37300 [Streptomyces rochei]|uniref:hypothetical protein n=1 Tax=Streptomyces rochei TaxID=1928 RepID=UPI002ACD8DF3|nr:hypothetical protein [Streptomyces rochei]WQC17188.1 hypothetical protein TR631_37300 [Streptomyces rochei]